MEKFKIALLTIGLSLVSAMSYSAQIVKEDKLETIDGFDTGLVTNVSGNKQAKDSSPNIRNFWIDEKIGSLVKVGGFQTNGSSATAYGSTTTLQDVRFGMTFYKPDGTKEYIVSDSSVVLRTSDFNSYSLVKAALDRTYNIRAKQIEDSVLFMNGRDNPFILSSTGGVREMNFIPKGQYPEYFDGRVWILNTASETTETVFCNLASTDGTQVRFDDPRAWANRNSLFVGRGDGGAITNGFNYGGILQAAKENSMWRLIGNSNTDYDWAMVNKESGFISAESMIESDGLVYGQGKDGFYEFNGAGMRRITDHIRPNIENIRTDTTRVLAAVWDTADDFSQFVATENIKISVPGTISLASDMAEINKTSSTVPPPASSTVTLTAVTTATVFGVIATTHNLTASLSYYPSLIQIWGKANDAANTTLLVVVRNARTGQFVQSPEVALGMGALQTVSFNMYFGTPSFTDADLNGGKCEVKVVMTAGNSAAITLASMTYLATVQLTPLLQSQFISKITTTTANSWLNFEADVNTNQGSVNFYAKSATSAVNLSTYPYAQIFPGNIPGFGTNKYIQWAATFTAQNPQVSGDQTIRPNVTNVTFNYAEGAGSNTRSFGIRWKGRWWIGVSTEATGNFPLFYVKAKATNSYKDAFTTLDGMNLRSLWKDGENVLYAGGSTSPYIYRLDYGQNHNGAAIDAYYETPDLPLGRPFFEKTFSAWMIDVDKESGASLLLGTSIDAGSFTEQSISITGSGRLIRQIPQNTVNSTRNFGNTFKIRARNNEKDKSISVNALGLIYQDSTVIPLPQ